MADNQTNNKTGSESERGDLEENIEDKEDKEEGEKEVSAASSNPMQRSSSRPQLDVSRAAIQGDFDDRNPTILLPNQSDDISHLALDIGGIVSLGCKV